MADYLVNRPFFLMISLDLMKTSEVRIAGDQPNSSTLFILRKNQFMYTNTLVCTYVSAANHLM